MDEQKTLKEKIDEVKTKVKAKSLEFGSWCSAHKESLIVIVPVAMTSGIELIKVIAKSHNQKEERRLKENFIYSKPDGHYFELKRAPKQSEWCNIDIRRKSGEYLGDILSDMKLLKK